MAGVGARSVETNGLAWTTWPAPTRSDSTRMAPGITRSPNDCRRRATWSTPFSSGTATASGATAGEATRRASSSCGALTVTHSTSTARSSRVLAGTSTSNSPSTTLSTWTPPGYSSIAAERRISTTGLPACASAPPTSRPTPPAPRIACRMLRAELYPVHRGEWGGRRREIRRPGGLDPSIFPSRSPRAQGGAAARLLQQLVGARQGLLGDRPAHHPGQLTGALLLGLQLPHADDHPSTRARRLLDHQVVVGEAGDLGEVGDDQHLPLRTEGFEPQADLHRRLAADAGVHLIEHERGEPLRLGPGRPDRQHDAGQLAPGGHPGQRSRRLAGVGR